MAIFKTAVTTFNFIATTLTVYSLLRDNKRKMAIGFVIWSILNAIATLL